MAIVFIIALSPGAFLPSLCETRLNACCRISTQSRWHWILLTRWISFCMRSLNDWNRVLKECISFAKKRSSCSFRTQERRLFSRHCSTFCAPSYLLLDHAVDSMLINLQDLIYVRNMSCCIMQTWEIRHRWRVCISCLQRSVSLIVIVVIGYREPFPPIVQDHALTKLHRYIVLPLFE